MAYANYPEDVLPIPSATYATSVESSCRRTPMSSGRNRQTQIYTSQFHFANVRWDLTDSEIELWKAFYNGALNNGSDWFTLNLAFGDGLKYNKAQFQGSYSVSHYGSFSWRVSAQLQLESIQEIDNQTDLEAAGALLGLVGEAWVDVLPPPKTGYSYAVTSANARTQIDSGQYVNRNRFERNVHIVSVSWQLTDAEMEYFRGWHRVILSLGAMPFDIDLAFGDGMKSNSAVMVGGDFSANYIAGPNGGYWTVSASLEVDAVDELKTWDEYLSEYETRSDSLPGALEQTENPVYESQGEFLDLSLAFYVSVSGHAKGVLSMPLRNSEFESQDALPSTGERLKLSDATYLAGP